MGFFKKLFGRKSATGGGNSAVETSANAATAPPLTGRKARRAARKQQKQLQQQQKQRGKSSSNRKEALPARQRDSPTELIGTDPSENSPAAAAALTVVTEPVPRRRGPDLSDGSQRPVLSPRSPNSHSSSLPSLTNSITATNTPQPQEPRSPAPVDLDDSPPFSQQSHSNSHEEKKEHDENEMLKQLSQQYVSQKQQQAVYSMSSEVPSPKLRFSAGNVSVNDSSTEGDDDGDSSTFNLSTDAEDTEYENLRRRLGAAGARRHMESVGNRSITSNRSIATNYTTDGESSVFPGLQSEDELTTGTPTQSVTKEAAQQSILNLSTPPITVDPATGASLVPLDDGYLDSHNGGFPKAAKADESEDFVALPSPSSSSPTKSSTSSKVPMLALPAKDSPERAQRRLSSPKASTTTTSATTAARTTTTATTNSLFRAQYSSHFMEAVYGAPSPGEKQPTSSASSRRNFTSSLPKKKLEPPPQKQQQQQFEPFAATSSSQNADTSFGMAQVFPPPPASGSGTTVADAFPSPEAFDADGFAAAAVDAFSPSSASTATNNKQNNNNNAKSNNTNNTDDFFANFADFSNFEDAFAKPSKPQEPQPHQRNVFIEGHAATTGSSSSSNPRLSNQMNSSFSADAPQNESTSLSELLAQAKSKSSRGSSNHSSGGGHHHQKKSSRSVSSAPVVNASYLRQQHNLRSSSRGGGGGDGTSVTDIIQSLEAANLSRGGGGSRSVGGRRRDNSDGQSSRDGASSVVSKDRRRRRRERRQQRSNGGEYSSDSEDDHEDSESWLFDEVTGALGPRGIAADLESLSGRSNRSNSSRGNRSHRSHRSHRSSSHRRHRRRTSADGAASVDSRGSRHSRDSRRSRYSHKSSRSYISQMSEQSRSVANDLLRLEMQLAMVGSGNEQGGTSSVGGRSRTSRGGGGSSAASTGGGRRTSTARRSRITVDAPPGKLGIILANKADSKGTVVSGVRTTSPLADKIAPGDRIVAIDGEDVSLMTVSEITTIMARKGDFDRTLTVLTTPRHTQHNSTGGDGMSSPVGGESSGYPHPRPSYRN